MKYQYTNSCDSDASVGAPTEASGMDTNIWKGDLQISDLKITSNLLIRRPR